MFRYVPLWFCAIGCIFWIVKSMALLVEGGTIDLIVGNSPTGVERDEKNRKEAAIAIVKALQGQSNCGYIFRVLLNKTLQFFTSIIVSLSMMNFIDLPFTQLPYAQFKVAELLQHVLDTPVTDREDYLLLIFPRVATIVQ